MRRKIYTAITVLISSLLCALCMIACGETDPSGNGEKDGHTHTLTKVERVNSDCTKDGNMEYYTCECGKWFEGADGKNEITDKSAVVLKKGHDIVTHQEKKATCTEKGWEAYETCKRCEYTTYKEISALGHNMVSHARKAATCTASGYEAYESCSRCGHGAAEKATIPALGHDYGGYTCKRCKAEKPGTAGIEYALVASGASYGVKGIGTAKGSDIVIAKTYLGKPVTVIGASAFEGCGSLVSVQIPDSVTRIGVRAFYGCNNLKSMEIPVGVTDIYGSSFAHCSGLESITVAQGNPKYRGAGNCLIETASKTLISGCKNSVIPSDGSVTSIGNYAFNGCSSLTSIEIPASVTSIGNSALSDCNGLTRIDFNGTVEQWNAIEKGVNWDSGTGAYTVYCTGGTVSK